MRKLLPVLMSCLLIMFTVAPVATRAGDPPAPPAGEKGAGPPAAPSAPQGGALDGKSFSGELVKSGAQGGDKDTLIFGDGKFRSTVCDGYGFKEVAYHAMKLGEAITFRVDSTSETFGKMTWQGRVRGETLEANVIWLKPGDERETYQIKAALDKK